MKIIVSIVAAFVASFIWVLLLLISVDSSTATSFWFSESQITGITFFVSILWILPILLILSKLFCFFRRLLENTYQESIPNTGHTIRKAKLRHLISWILLILLTGAAYVLNKIAIENTYLWNITHAVFILWVPAAAYMVLTLSILIKAKFGANNFLTRDLF